MILSNSCILPSLIHPRLEELPGLTADSTWSWLVHSLGWHEPALSEPSRKIVRRMFDSIPPRLRNHLIRPDILPHHHFNPDQIDPNLLAVRRHYAATFALRKAPIRNVHKLFRDPNKNKVERYPDEHGLWVPESELQWLRSRIGMKGEADGKKIDFPVSLRWSLRKSTAKTSTQSNNILSNSRHSSLNKGDEREKKNEKVEENKENIAADQASSESAGKVNENVKTDENRVNSDDDDSVMIGQVKLMVLDERNEFWPVGFNTRSRGDEACIIFNNRQPRLGVDIPDWVGQIGITWIETGKYGPNNRVLFQKTSSDDLIGILLWPKFPDNPNKHPTPRIPVYKKDIIEVVDGDRLLIFLGPKRGIDDVVVEVEISSFWASKWDKWKIYAHRRYIYPNPCERYPHCVRRPILSPKDLLDPEILEDKITPKSEYNSRQEEEEEEEEISLNFEIEAKKDSSVMRYYTVEEPIEEEEILKRKRGHYREEDDDGFDEDGFKIEFIDILEEERKEEKEDVEENFYELRNKKKVVRCKGKRRKIDEEDKVTRNVSTSSKILCKDSNSSKSQSNSNRDCSSKKKRKDLDLDDNLKEVNVKDNEKVKAKRRKK